MKLMEYVRIMPVTWVEQWGFEPQTMGGSRTGCRPVAAWLVNDARPSVPSADWLETGAWPAGPAHGYEPGVKAFSPGLCGASDPRNGKVVELRHAHALCLVDSHDKADGAGWKWMIRIGCLGGLLTINPELEADRLLSLNTRAYRLQVVCGIRINRDFGFLQKLISPISLD